MQIVLNPQNSKNLMNAIAKYMQKTENIKFQTTTSKSKKSKN